MTVRVRLSGRSWLALSACALIAAVLGLSGAPAQGQGRPYRIGVLSNAFMPGIPPIMGLRAGIKAEGLEEGA